MTESDTYADEWVALVRQAQAGDGDAFAELFQRLHLPVLNYVYHMLGDRQAAEDVTQDAFIRAHERLAQLGPPWDFKSWVFRIASNLAVDGLRSGKRFVDIEEPMDLSGPPTTRRPSERQVQRAETRAAVRATLQQMPTAYAQALLLREFNGLSYREVAQALECSYDNARQLVHRARLSFRQIHGIRMLAESGAARCHVLDDLLSAYADDELSAEERRAVREHIASCEHCKETEEDMRKVAGALAGLMPIMPSPGWVQEVLRQLKAGAAPAPQAPGGEGGSGAGDGGGYGGGEGGPGGGGAGGGEWAASWRSGLRDLSWWKLGAGGLLALFAGGMFLIAGAFALYKIKGPPPTSGPPTALSAGGADATPAPVPAKGTASLTPTATATASFTPTPTATLGPPFVVALENSNCRFGPLPVYDVIGYLLAGQRAAVDGRNAESTWWWIERVDGVGHCWIWDGLVEKEGDFSAVPIIAAPPTPTPTPTATPACTIDLDRKTCEAVGGYWLINGSSAYCLCPQP